jgi:beta-1,4-N-acetylglucosaminyltransferase
MRIFVTVGTTRFDQLIDHILEQKFIHSLDEIGVEYLTVQHGNSPVSPVHNHNINIYNFKPSLQQDIAESDIVISSGGAGTILEVLELQKDLIVLVNETLQDNHQKELVEKLSEQGFLTVTTLSTLSDELKRKRMPKKWNNLNNLSLVNIVNELL